jgi:hypothetical protein
MQTFLPFSDFQQSAKVLDMKRLGKQRVETLQILKSLTSRDKTKWFYHPAVQMWASNTECLVEYGIAICSEWIGRGYKDTCLEKIKAFRTGTDVIPPKWLGNEKFHSSHRGILLDKKYQWYSQFGWKENRVIKVDGKYPYFWPTKQVISLPDSSKERAARY